MGLITILVFVSAFAVVSLLMLALAKPSRSRLAHTALFSALRPHFSVGEEVIDIRKEHRLSTIPWLNELLSGISVILSFRRTLVQAGLKITPAALILTATLLWVVTAGIVNWKAHFGLASVLIALPSGMIPFLYVLMRRNKRLNQMRQRLPEALDLMASALRAGHSMNGALGSAAREAPEPIGRELRICFEELTFGVDLRTAMNNLLDRVPLQDARMMAVAMLIHKESGGNLAEVLEKTALVIRDRARLVQEIRVKSAQGRLTGWILSLLPVFMVVLLHFLNPAYLHTLVETPQGLRVVVGAVAMDLVGLMVIHRIVNIRI
jgi:tight adherence protein B